MILKINMAEKSLNVNGNLAPLGSFNNHLVCEIAVEQTCKVINIRFNILGDIINRERSTYTYAHTLSAFLVGREILIIHSA